MTKIYSDDNVGKLTIMFNMSSKIRFVSHGGS